MSHSKVAGHIQLAKSYPLARTMVNSATVITLLLFLVSLFSPLFTLEKFYFFSNTVSLISALSDLIEQGNIIIFLIIVIFSIIFPVLKLSVILFLWNSNAGLTVQALLKLIHQFGKWSMLDVFVVALMVVSIKFDAVADVEIQYGLYLFLTSVILSMLISEVSNRFLEQHLSFVSSTNP